MGFNHIEKKCGDCAIVKPVEEFYRSSHRARDAYCKACRRVRDADRAQKKAALQYDPDARRDYKLQKLYGITLADYIAMGNSQGWVCALCGDAEVRKAYDEAPRLVVDHNHHTGKVRGLLCCGCNTRLAAIEDEQFMLLARAYLREHDGQQFVDDATPPERTAAARAVQEWIAREHPETTQRSLL